MKIKINKKKKNKQKQNKIWNQVVTSSKEKKTKQNYYGLVDVLPFIFCSIYCLIDL